MRIVRRTVRARGWGIWTILLSVMMLTWTTALALQEPSALVVPKDRQATNVAIITIHGPIDGEGVMAASIERRVQLAERAGANAIVFDINCPGGEVDSVLRICNAIKRSRVGNTVAWINPDAYSGGAIIALACRRIVVNDPANFGDAKPIAGGPMGLPFAGQVPPEMLKKILPPLLAEVVDSARRHNQYFGAYLWDEYLLQAMIADDVELWLVRHPRTGTRVCIDRSEFEMLFPGQPAGGPTRVVGIPGSRRAPEAVASRPGSPAGSAAISMVAPDVESRQAISTSRPRFTEADRGQWELVEKITDGTAPVTLKAPDMFALGLASNDTEVIAGQTVFKPIRTDQDLLAYLNGKNLIRFDRVWSERLVLVMTHWAVRALLIIVFLIALFVEMTHPGIMVPGAVALVALIGLFAPPMLIGMSGWWAIASILLGIALLVLELFVIPGFGVAGVLGLIFLFAGLVGSFLPRGEGVFPGMGEGGSSAAHAATIVLLSMFTAGVCMFFIARHFKTMPILGRLVLQDPASSDDDGFLAQAMGTDPRDTVRIGDEGVALTPMRPAGRVEIGERIIDAVADFGFIDAGRRVRVVRRDGLSIGVEEVRS
jgi:membrane-bound serine protease (ClpP class)